MKRIISFIGLSMLLVFGIVNSPIVNAYTEGNVDVTVTTLAHGSEASSVVLKDQAYGSLIEVTSSTSAPTGQEFSYWLVNGVIRDDLLHNNQFTVTDNLELIAVFEPSDNQAHAILFVDSNGKRISSDYVVNDGTIVPPSTDEFTKPNYVVSITTPWKEANGAVAVFENITESKVFILQYELAANVFGIDVYVDGKKHQYAYNELATITSHNEDFTHWEEDGVIVSYDNPYTFSVIKRRNLIAQTDGVLEPIITLLDVSGIRAGSESYLGQLNLPIGYNLVEMGLLASNNEEILSLDTLDVEIIPSTTYNPHTMEFLRSITNEAYTTFRAYAVVKDSADNLVKLYSENNLNKAFKTLPLFDNREFGEAYLRAAISETVSSSFTYDRIRFEYNNYQSNTSGNPAQNNVEFNKVLTNVIKANTGYELSFEVISSKAGKIRPYLQKTPKASPWTSIIGNTEYNVTTDWSTITIPFTTSSTVEDAYAFSMEIGAVFAKNESGWLEFTNIKLTEVPVIIKGHKDLSVRLADLPNINYLNGVKANDINGDDLTANIVVNSDNVLNQIGQYEVTYSVENSEGQIATKTIILTVEADTKEMPYLDNRDFNIKLFGVSQNILDLNFGYDEIYFGVNNLALADGYTSADRNLQVEMTLNNVLKDNTTYTFSVEVAASKAGNILPYIQNSPVASPYTNLFSNGGPNTRYYDVSTVPSIITIEFTTGNSTNYSFAIEFGELFEEGETGWVTFTDFQFVEKVSG